MAKSIAQELIEKSAREGVEVVTPYHPVDSEELEKRTPHKPEFDKTKPPRFAVVRGYLLGVGPWRVRIEF